MAKFKNVYFVEITDTFGGEANYSWATRHKIHANTMRGAVNKLAKYSGMQWKVNSNYDDMMRYDSKSGATCFFICEFDEVEHGNYRLNEI